MEEDSLELTGLLEEANRLRQSNPELADTEAFTDRTVYYYAQQGLLPRASRRRGPGTTYPADFVDRLLFIRRLQKERSLTLAHIREVMEKASSQTIHNVAHGREPLELRWAAGYEPKDLQVHGDVMALKSVHAPLRSSAPPLMSRMLSDDGGAAPAARSRRKMEKRDDSSKRYSIGDDAELQIDRSLTPLQEKRVEQVVGLLRSILEEDEENR
jgi:DNA-binding transcriptional MerR regulator